MIDPEKIAWKTTRHRGIFIHPIWRDERTGDTAILIRMEPGCAYPRHRHIGDEEVLILQGAMRDEVNPKLEEGDFCRYPAGSSHHPVALERDEACILFAIAREGIELV